MATRITGLTSGLDTEALVSAMVMNYQSKVTKNQQAQTSLQYKRDALKSVNTDVYSLFNSVDKLRWSSAYSLKTTTVSDSTKAKVSAADNAVNGTQTLVIEKLAQAGYLTGGNIKSKSTLSDSTKLSDIYTTSGGKENTFEGGSISVTVNGKERKLELSADSTAKDLVGALKDAGVNANFDAANGRFFISSKSSGADNDFKLVATDAKGLASLKALGLYVADKESIAEYEKWADYNKMTEDEWTAFTEKEYESKTISYASRAASNASKYNSAMSAIDSANKQIDSVLDGFKDEAGNRLYATASDLKKHLTTIKEGLDGDSTFEPYRKTVEDKNEEGIVTGSHYEYDLKAMEDAVKAGTLDESALDAYKKISEDITKFQKASDEIDANTKTIDENQTTVNSLQGKVNIELDDEGNFKTATALSAPADGEDPSPEWEALVLEVDGDNESAKEKLKEQLKERATQSEKMLENITDGEQSDGAVRLSGSDAKIILNGAVFTSSANNFSINGLSIEATAKTEGAITITTATDSQGIYDKIKDFFSQYNDVVNKMSKLYNAESAKGYDPLTEDQKAAMSETEITKWENKIKDSILRRDNTLSGIIQAMTSSMAKSYDIGGKSYSLSTFGIKTLGYFASGKNENYAYHIDGDSDDSTVSGTSDKLMKAIIDDPESVVSFFQKLSSSLYDSLNAKMKSSSLSSAYTIYNDKQMASEYSDYTSTITKWQDKVSDMENYYFKKFGAMEATLSKLQASTNNMASFFG